MELVIGFMVLLLAAATIAVAFGPTLRPALARRIPGLDPRHFTCRIHEVEDPQLTLHFQVCGRIYAPRAGLETRIRIQLRDLTSASDPKPILTRNPDCQQTGSMEFVYTIDNGPLPSRVSILKDWVDLLAIPCRDLVFPRQGYRTLELTVSVLSQEDGKTLAEARSQVLTLSEQDGYESIQQNRAARRRALIRIAAAVWNLSGRLDRGRAVIEQNLAGKFSEVPPGEADSVETLVESTVGKSERAVILESCESIRQVAGQAECIEALTLCLEIAATATVITDEISQVLTLIADRLAISPQRFHRLRQKILANRDCTLADPRHLLGIDESMSNEEALRQLTSEYRKWNARVTHADETVRRQADRMLNLIMELRSRYQHCA